MEYEFAEFPLLYDQSFSAYDKVETPTSGFTADQNYFITFELTGGKGFWKAARYGMGARMLYMSKTLREGE